MLPSKQLFLGTALSLLLASGASAQQPPPRPAAPPPASAQQMPAMPDSGTLQRADRDMRRVLEALMRLGGKPIEQLSPAEARQQPTPADAVMAVLREENRQPPAMRVDRRDVTYRAGQGEQPARIYTPRIENNSGPLPVIVYYHGGGWVIADVNTYDASAMALAERTRAIVVSAEYRHAPENRFPAAHQDAFAAYRWVLENAQSFGGDPRRVAVAGESAGGNLAANVAIMARDQNVQAPVHMLLVYPVAGNDMTTPSYQQNVNAKPLNMAMMQWFVSYVVTDQRDLLNPMINLVGANLRGLPPATVITAEIDPLRSEGALLAQRLRQAGVQTRYQNYQGVTHEFFGMAAVVADAARAQNFAARNLRAAFQRQPSGTAQGR